MSSLPFLSSKVNSLKSDVPPFRLDRVRKPDLVLSALL